MITRQYKNIKNQNRAFVRFIQLSYTAPLMDVYIDNRLVLSDLDFQEVSRYLSLAPGSRNIKLKVATTNRTILEDPNMFLRAGNSYSVYIVGDSNNRMGLQVLIPFGRHKLFVILKNLGSILFLNGILPICYNIFIKNHIF